MPAHGFTIEQMVELIRAGLATAQTERIVAGPRTLEVARVRITQVGGGRSPSRDPPPNKHISPGWGSDELSKLWDAARSNRSAPFVRKQPAYERLVAIGRAVESARWKSCRGPSMPVILQLG